MGIAIPLIETHDENEEFRTEHVAYAAYIATHRLTRLFSQMLAPIGLTYSQYLVMMVLWERAPQTVGEIGQTLSLDTGTLTPLLKRMQTAELVERQRDPDDERRVLVRPTPRGRALHADAADVARDMRGTVPLSSARAEAIHDDLRRIADTLT